MANVRVKSRLHAKVEIALFDKRADGVGANFLYRSASKVVLHPGVNEVDEDFIRAWIDQHEKSPLLEFISLEE